MSNIKNINISEFNEQVLKSELPVLVDFWAEWCAPCRMISPILENIYNDNSNKLKIVKVNVDDNPDLAMKYNVTSIPAMKIFVSGEEVKTIIGAKPKEDLEQDLKEYL